MRIVAAAAGAVVLGYAVVAAATWWDFGTPPLAETAQQDPLLDRFMPVYEVVERHAIEIDAPPAIVLKAATEMDLDASPLVRAIFRAREIVLRADPPKSLPRGLIARMTALGWGVLAEAPGREIVMGAVTEPWAGNVTFHAVCGSDFRAFQDPGHVKIAWTLRADDRGGAATFRTETRAIATSADARRKFRRYWAFASPGVALIRRLLLAPLKGDAEMRARLNVLPIVLQAPHAPEEKSAEHAQDADDVTARGAEK